MDNSYKYISRIDEVINQLETQRAFIKDSLTNPETLFDRAAEVFESKKDSVFQIMNIYRNGCREMNVHEFQNFLCHIINRYFTQVFNLPQLIVKIRSPNTFPSIFAVYYNDIEIIQFDIFEKYYGIRDRTTEEDINKKYDKRLKEYRDELELLKNKLEDMNYAYSNTHKWMYKFHKKEDKNIWNKVYYGIKDHAFLLFQGRKVSELIKKNIETYKNQMKECEESFKKCDKREEEIINNRQKDQGIAVVELLFKKHNYKLETERHKLY